MLELEACATERRRSSRPHSTRPKLGTNGAEEPPDNGAEEPAPRFGTSGGVTPERVDLGPPLRRHFARSARPARPPAR